MADAKKRTLFGFLKNPLRDKVDKSKEANEGQGGTPDQPVPLDPEKIKKVKESFTNRDPKRKK